MRKRLQTSGYPSREAFVGRSKHAPALLVRPQVFAAPAGLYHCLKRPVGEAGVLLVVLMLTGTYLAGECWRT